MRTEQQKQDFLTIAEIARAAVKTCAELGVEYDQMTAVMDLDHAHQDIPLDLETMLDASDDTSVLRSDFIHDIGGIRRHMNRETFKLEDCFVPRFALKQ